MPPDGLAIWEYTIAELLSDEGYATSLNGKWHVGSQIGRLPNNHGYDEWWGQLSFSGNCYWRSGRFQWPLARWSKYGL